MTGLRLQLLGEPALRGPGGVVHGLGRHDALLLAVLALDGAQPRAALAARLWPDADARHAGLSLRQRLHRLQRAAGRPLATGTQVLRLAEGLATDLQGYDAALAADPAHGRAELLAALADGPEGELADWLQQARARWREQRAAALARLAEDHAAAGRLAAALAYAERLVQEQPLAEHAHRRLVRLHHLRGDSAAALAAYDRCVQCLRQELGVAPAPETEALAGAVQRSAVPEAAPAAPLPVVLLRPPRLVGRDAEWQALADALAQGERLVLVSAEAGMGKSRLVGDFAAHQHAGLVAARPGDAPLPGAVLARLLRALAEAGALAGLAAEPRSELARLVPEWGAPPPGPERAVAQQHALGLAAHAAAQAGVRLLVVDDLHAADAESVLALLGLAADPAAPMLCLATRPEGLAALADPPAHRHLRLAPLGAEAVAALLHSLALPGLEPAAWVGPLLRHTGGNPLFLLQTLGARWRGDGLAAVPEGLPQPAGVGELIAQRLAALPAAALRLAQVAALAGPVFSVALAAQVLGCSVAELARPWQALLAAQVLHDDAFAHDLVQEATLRSVPAPVARALRAQIAQAAAALGADAAAVAELAWQGGDLALATQQLPRAADAAHRAGQRALELRLADRWAEAAAALGQPEAVFDARLRAFDAALLLLPLAEVRQRLHALRGAAQGAVQQAQAGMAEARLATHAQEPARTAQAATEALRALATLPAGHRQARALRLEALVLRGAGEAHAGQRDAALATLQGCRAQADRLARPALQRLYWSMYGFVLVYADRRHEAAAAFERSVALSLQQGEWAEAMTDLANHAGTLAQLGQVEKALALSRQAEQLRARLGPTDAVAALHSRMNEAVLCARLGCYAAALPALQEVVPAFQASGAAVWAAAAENHLANLWLALGQWARARALLAVPIEPGHTGHLRRVVLQARLARALGHAGTEVLGPLQQQAGAAARESAVNRLGWALAVAELLPPEAALAAARQAGQEATAAQLDGLAQHARLCHAEALLALNRRAAAQRMARQVLAARAAGCHAHDMAPGEFWWRLLRCLPAAEARQALQQGQAWLQATAAREVPDAFRDAFVHRVAAHQALRAQG